MITRTYFVDLLGVFKMKINLWCTNTMTLVLYN